MQQKRKRVCVIVPAYNESAVIKNVLKNAKKIFSASTHDISIVVINDCSRDDTGTLASSEKVLVVSHLINVGAGGATATGLRYAEKEGYDVAVTMDADGQHDPRDILRGINHLISTGSDLAIGSRLIDSSGMSKVKIVGNKGLSTITWILFGIRSTDSQSGLRVFSRESLQTLRWKASGYEFASEMLWRAHQKNLTISEFPIKAIYTKYSRSKGQSNWNGVNIVKSMIKQRFVEILE